MTTFGGPMVRTRSPERGSLFLWAVGLNALLVLLVIQSIPFFQTVTRVQSQFYRQEQARNLAEAGIAAALWENQHGGADLESPNWSGPLNQMSCNPMLSNMRDGVTTTINTKCKVAMTPTTAYRSLQAADGTLIGDYAVVVLDVNPITNTWDTFFPRVVARGYVPTKAAPQYATTAIVRGAKHIHRGFAAYGVMQTWIRVEGGSAPADAIILDSYDSTLGAYGGKNIRPNADVGALGGPTLLID